LTADDHGYTIPDFEKDAQAIAAYDEARLRFERREAGDAEAKTRATFAKKRDQIRAEINAANLIYEDRRDKAARALAHYSARYPHRMDGKRPLKPSFWEQLFSFWAAGRLFKKAVQTAADASAAQSARRRKEHDEEELEQQLKRTLYLQEEAIKKRLESQEGTDTFHARPGVAALFKRVEEIRAERAAYQARLGAGGVSPQEQRDREFAQAKVERIEAPFEGYTIVRVARYGDLTYFILRNLERKLFWLPYDARLEPLIEHVFDTYRLADTLEAKLTRGPDQRPLPTLQHYLTNFKNEDVARSEFRKARTAFRTPRVDIPPMTGIDPDHQTILDLLANFAKTVGAPRLSAAVGEEAPILDPIGGNGAGNGSALLADLATTPQPGLNEL
jgi:hypothetical protein